MRLAADARVIVPTVRAGAPLAAALEALDDPWRRACTVVVNGTPEAEVAVVRDRFPDVCLLYLDANRGFSGAVNRGIDQARAQRRRVVILLNDDAVVAPGALDALTAAVLADARVGSAAGVLLDRDGTLVDTAGLRCDPGLTAHDVGRGEPPEALRGCAPPLGPSGGLAAYRLEALERVGGFDEGFFAYYEDIDLALRLCEAGWMCRLVPEATARHLGSATLGWRSVEKATIVGHSRGRITRKYGVHRRPAAWPFLGLEVAAGVALSVELRSPAPLHARAAGFREARQTHRYPAGEVDRRSLRATLGARVSRRYRASVVARWT